MEVEKALHAIFARAAHGTSSVVSDQTLRKSTVGPQPVIPLNFLPGQAIRASVAGWTSGTVSVAGYMAASMRD
jgi:hypothetical protein